MKVIKFYLDLGIKNKWDALLWTPWLLSSWGFISFICYPSDYHIEDGLVSQRFICSFCVGKKNKTLLVICRWVFAFVIMCLNCAYQTVNEILHYATFWRIPIHVLCSFNFFYSIPENLHLHWIFNPYNFYVFKFVKFQSMQILMLWYSNYSNTLIFMYLSLSNINKCKTLCLWYSKYLNTLLLM